VRERFIFRGISLAATEMIPRPPMAIKGSVTASVPAQHQKIPGALVNHPA